MPGFDETPRETEKRSLPPRLTVQQAMEQIDVYVARIESEFEAKHGRPIDLIGTEADFQNLGEFFVAKKLREELPAIARYDVGHRIIRNCLERGDYWKDLEDSDRIKVFDTIIGRIHYNPPRSYSQARLADLDSLIGSELEAPIEADLTRMRDDVWRIGELASKHLDFGTYSDAIANPGVELFMEFHINETGFEPVRLAGFRTRFTWGAERPDKPTESYSRSHYI